MNQESNLTANAALVRADVLVLLRERRYEEALALLYRARSESPGNAELQKSIDQIKEFLIGAYAKRLGGLDRIATPLPVLAGRSPDVVLISRYIDGTSSFGDVARMCPLGQLRTLQVLVELYARSEPAPVEADPPRSGLRGPAAEPSEAMTVTLIEPGDEPAPDTARSASAAAHPPPAPVVEPPLVVETEAAREYRELFALGTAAFVQRRYDDAVATFEACSRLRPDDNAAAVMLRRSLRDLESR